MSGQLLTLMHGPGKGDDDRALAAAARVFLVFLRLGLTSFGGPLAHLGYYREEFVVRRRWLDDRGYADLVAICQILPGPASSQVGFAIGLKRAGWAGALAAWLAFTLPSAALMLLFAASAGVFAGAAGAAALHGLRLVAVAVVAQAVFGMARTLCRDWQTALIAASAALLILAGALTQIPAILLGAAFGALFLRRVGATGEPSPVVMPVGRGASLAAATLFAAGLLGSWLARDASMPVWQLFAACYRSGALVFGGGHVVLPLLEHEIVPRGWLDTETFLAGYGAAQALPGPLFAFAAYVGAASALPGAPVLNAGIALVGIFLPGLLLVAACVPGWTSLRRLRGAETALQGSGAAVVGVLAAAWWQPVVVTTVGGWGDIGIAALAWLVLSRTGWPVWLTVALTVTVAVIRTALAG